MLLQIHFFFTATHKVFTQYWQELWCYGDGDRYQVLPIVPHAAQPTRPTSIALYNMQTSNVWLVAHHLNNHHGRPLTSNQRGRSTFLWTLSQYPQTPTFSKLEQGQQNSCLIYQDILWMLGCVKGWLVQHQQLWMSGLQWSQLSTDTQQPASSSTHLAMTNISLVCTLEAYDVYWNAYSKQSYIYVECEGPGPHTCLQKPDTKRVFQHSFTSEWLYK